MHHKMKTVIAVTLSLLVYALVFVSCSQESNDAGEVSKNGAATPLKASDSNNGAADPIVPSGWKTVTSDNWTFSIPDDWVEGSMRTYHPKGAVNSMGVAQTFCVTGVNEIEETGVGDNRLKYMVGFGFLNKTPKTVCGKDGYMVEGKEGLALLYEFEPRPGYGPEFAVDAIWCTASSSSTFRQYEAIFRHIIDSVECLAD